MRARVVGEDIELRVTDDGSGIEPDRLSGLLAGAAGIGLANVDGPLRRRSASATRCSSSPSWGTARRRS